jgi:leucyl aminopeptidase
MPGGNATRPGDVVRTLSGQTVEILNTDAEGRLILADALAYAKKFAPAAIIDIATLTGACVVALGKDAAGLFCDDSDLAAGLLRAGEKLGERSWRMPLWEDAGKEALKSHVADLANAGPREGGAIHAAVFLKQFVRKDIRWAHLDIAAADNTESPVNVKGASGFGVRTLLEAVFSADQLRE